MTWANQLPFVFVFKLRATLLLSGYMFNILPNGQCEPTASFDLIITKSLFERFISEFVHLVQLVSGGK